MAAGNPQHQKPWLVWLIAIGLGISLAMHLATDTGEAERGGLKLVGALLPLIAGVCLPVIAGQVTRNPDLSGPEKSTLTLVAWIGAAVGVIQGVMRLLG
jgi:hypothetical protein